MFLRNNLFAITWAALIFLLCMIPGRDMPDTSFWDLLTFDKVSHTMVFAVLSFQCSLGFYKQYAFRVLRYHAVEAATMFSILYGALLEIIQHLALTDRFGSIYDFIANTAGSLIGALWFHVLFKNIYLR